MSEVIEDTRVGLIGKTIGRYQVTAELGRGGMATVYRAHDPQLGRDVAIKVMHGAFAGRAELEARFRREARAVAAIKHDGIINVFDFATATAGEPGYIVTEIVEGPTLRMVMDRHGGRLWPEVAALVAVRLAGALGAAHARGIVHRDVKPDNVMFDLASPATVRVLLTDFGIAHMTEAETMTATGAIVGSPIYMSPEQARGLEVGPTSDVFSLGVLMYHLTTGRPPFAGRDPLTAIAAILRGEFLRPSQVDAHVGPALEAVILRCMKTAPGERFPDGSALASALGEIAREVEKLVEVSEGDAGGALRRFFDEGGGAGVGAAKGEGAAGAAFAARVGSRVAEQAFEQARAHARRGELARALAETNRVFAYAPAHAGAQALLAGIARRRRTGKIIAAGLLAAVVAGGGGVAAQRWRAARGGEAREGEARESFETRVAVAQAPVAAKAASPPAGSRADTLTSDGTGAAAPISNSAAVRRKPALRGHGVVKPASAEQPRDRGGPAASAPLAATTSAGAAPTPATGSSGAGAATTPSAAVAISAPAAAAAAAPLASASLVLRASQGFCSPSMDDQPATIHPTYDRVNAGVHRVFCTLPGGPKIFVADYDLRAGSRANLVIVPGADGRPLLSRPD